MTAPKPPQNLRQFQSLVEIVKVLRGPHGCPWDKQQTHKSLTRFAIEEAHELSEAIESGVQQEIKEELGDLLLQVVLHAEIADQAKSFSIDDVIEVLNEKMVRRHPHVFSNHTETSAEEVKQNWEEIKRNEKQQASALVGFDLPKDLPALLASFKIGEKTKKYNFDWTSLPPVIEKVKEELLELEHAIKNKDQENIQEELGDLLFSVAQVARHLDVDPEQALRKTNKKFVSRFLKMQQLALKQGLDFKNLNSDQLEALWVSAKTQSR
jgi:tetrapyrrole methylase family protein/MazG family protein